MDSNTDTGKFKPTGLCTSRNTLASLLPVEILQDIFIRSARHCFREHHDCVAPAVPCWVNISYVCHYWRGVALRCPTLWAYVFIASQYWTEELLRRSKEAPLKISFRAITQRQSSLLDSFWEKVKDHAERIEELCLNLLPSQTRRALSTLSSPTPRLQYLSITVDPIYQQWGFEPSHIESDAPALRTLELSGCPALLHSFRLDGLTSLRLSSFYSQPRQTIKQFLVTLRAMRNLKDLYLDNPFSDATGFSTLSSTALMAIEKIDLPHLSRLFVNAAMANIVIFLSCTNIPSNSNVWLKRARRQLSFDSQDLFYALLAQRYHQAPPISITRTLVLDIVRPYGDNRLTCSTHNRDFTALSVDVWESDFPFQMTSYLENMIDICHVVSLLHVQSLCIANPPLAFESSFWRSILGCLPNVRYIKLCRGSMPDFSVFSPTASEDMGIQDSVAVSAGPVLPPLLEELELEGISFSSALGIHSLSSVMPNATGITALSNRNGSRGRLTMTRCRVDDSDNTFDLVMVWGDGEVRVVSERVYDSHASGEEDEDMEAENSGQGSEEGEDSYEEDGEEDSSESE